jgi:hypothetical protein
MVIKGVVKYWDLGREHASGTVTIEAKNDKEFNDKMEREFSKHLVSSNIGFDMDTGNIYAGFHCVGKFILLAKEVV